MKRFIFAFLATICSVAAIGQQAGIMGSGDFQYLNDFIFPHYLESGCYDTNNLSAIGVAGYQHYLAMAQPFHTDTTVSLKGIAAYVCLYQPDLMNAAHPCYFQIRDASLERIIAQIRYDTIVSNYESGTLATHCSVLWIEKLFDSTAVITDSLFYVVMTLPTDSNQNYAFINTVHQFGLTCTDTTFPILGQISTKQWVHYGLDEPAYFINQSDNHDSIAVPREMLVFPIRGTVSSLHSPESFAENISIYPNPSNETITITGKGFDQVKLYDMLGRVKIIKKTLLPQTSIDISTLSAGAYTLKLYHHNIAIGTKKIIKN